MESLHENEALKREVATLKKRLSELEAEYEAHKRLELDAFAIGDAISDGICVVNSNGIVEGINLGYTEITGIEAEEIVGKHIQEMVDKKYFSSAVSMMVIKEKKKVSSIATISKSGKKVLITGNPYFDESGNIIRVLTVMRDLTELIRMKEKLEETEKKNEQYLKELSLMKDGGADSGLIGKAPSIQKLRNIIAHVAKTEATVLISGETGVGKEVVAREIHRSSDRRSEQYITINCAAIPENLLETELFGYEKGAFTGADKKAKLGLFEIANNGTILLDEIGEMPLKLQTKILRVLQEKEITRVGGTESIKIDVRVIAATNQNLEAQIKSGSFREDLFYRLNVVPIVIPPLRERKEDITLLAYSFMEKFNRKYNRHKNLEASAMYVLQRYWWPGNVRELENVIERLIIVETDDSIKDSNIVNILGTDRLINDFAISETISLKEAVNILEKDMIEKALRKHRSTYKVAELLGVTQPTIVRKAQSLGIKDW
jgi:PAS domain S-box-containing protein